ncbi:MAG: phosphohydrolase [Candidatus Bathyarchaeota archaeon B26-2]|nr:MAG: phosphohydrolase [Candidatus Bathyarchaeota archaeon B26-2]
MSELKRRSTLREVSPLNRDEALSLVKTKVKNRRIFCHMLAVEAIMRKLAGNLGEDEDLWGLTGLLHDIDFEETRDHPERHGLKAVELLMGDVPEDVLRAIKAHNYEYTGVEPETRMEKALIASDALSGLLVACALVMPSKKMSEVKIKTVKKKFKDKDFARGADRGRISLCEDIGLTREEFFEIGLEALKGISQRLGL